MTEFPPSKKPERPQAPFDPADGGAGSGVHPGKELAPEANDAPADEMQAEAPARGPVITALPLETRATPELLTEPQEERSTFEPAFETQELFDDEAWRRISPRGLYARLFRPILGGVLLGLLLAPVTLLVGVIALCNWASLRDRSKVFFKQTRVGYRGEEFELLKFRTMRDTSQSHYDSWRDGNEAARVTKFGSFLRRSHLDELPQIFNILRGDMAFIGPRPEMVEVNEQIQSDLPTFYQRLAVRPGITGFAQITQGYAGNDIYAYRRKLEADLVYINDLSLQRDLGVLLVTPFWMLRLLGWQNDPAAQGEREEIPGGVIAGSISPAEEAEEDIALQEKAPTPRPGDLAAGASRVLSEIDPYPTV